MKDPYTILGVSRDATDDQIKEAYRTLARKYHPDNYGDDNPLKDLAVEKMQEVNAAYEQIRKERAGGGQSSSGTGSYEHSSAGGIYTEIRKALNAHRFGEASRLISSVPEGERIAEWHYLNSILIMRRGNVNDAMRELEIACDMEPGNMEYQKAKEMFNNSARGYGSTYYGGVGNTTRDSSSDCCEVCLTIKLCDCLCECMGGDLIPCI
ncbi:MAG TPA: molecular chaperone DnaJ [Clostridiales bacterium]|nr:molecular chaperone DnaJ [Clostridiales bacterium]